MNAVGRANSCGKAGPKPPLEIAGAIPTFPTAPATTTFSLTILITFCRIQPPASLRSDD